MGGFVNALGGIGQEGANIGRARELAREQARQRIQDLQQAQLVGLQLRQGGAQIDLEKQRLELEKQQFQRQGQRQPFGNPVKAADGKLYQAYLSPDGRLTYEPLPITEASPEQERLNEFRRLFPNFKDTPEERAAAEAAGFRLPAVVKPDEEQKLESYKKHLKLAYPKATDQQLEKMALSYMRPAATGATGIVNPRAGGGKSSASQILANLRLNNAVVAARIRPMVTLYEAQIKQAEATRDRLEMQMNTVMATNPAIAADPNYADRMNKLIEAADQRATQLATQLAQLVEQANQQYQTPGMTTQHGETQPPAIDPLIDSIKQKLEAQQ